MALMSEAFENILQGDDLVVAIFVILHEK